jgi:hypothetical protein
MFFGRLWNFFQASSLIALMRRLTFPTDEMSVFERINDHKSSGSNN